MLSEPAGRLLAKIRTTPGMTLCPLCAATRLGVERWDVMKLIRELVTDGRVTCAVGGCGGCGVDQLIARPRPTRYSH